MCIRDRYTAIDVTGNTTLCVFDVTVNDTESPFISNCPADTTLPSDSGLCGAVYSWPTILAIDNCSDESEELLVNGGFETGDLSGWTTQDLAGAIFPWAASLDAVGQEFPIEGDYLAMNGFDGDGPGEFTMYQDVTIPGDATEVTLFWSEFLFWNLNFGQGLSLSLIHI